jgi:hypothetical protein
METFEFLVTVVMTVQAGDDYSARTAIEADLAEVVDEIVNISIRGN